MEKRFPGTELTNNTSSLNGLQKMKIYLTTKETD